MIINYQYMHYTLLIILSIAIIGNASILPILFSIPSSLFQVLLYGALIIILLYFPRGVNINFTMFTIVIVAIMSLLLSQYNQEYNSYARFFTWLLLVSTIGPLTYNKKLVELRTILLKYFLILFMVIGVISAFYYFLGLPHLGRGHFTGITSHSMTLAPISAIGALYAFYLYIKEISLTWKLAYIIFFILNIISLFYAASRTSFLGMLAGLFFLLLINTFKYKKTTLIIILFLSIYSVYSLNNISNNTRGKDSLIDRKNVNTRAELWSSRLLEFHANPFLGVGFASQDNRLLKITKINQNGSVEPGSTYLMILSMTGILGALSFLILLLKSFINKKFIYNVFINNNYLGAVYIFFSIHFIAEGYIYSSGSMMAFLFWLLLGVTYPYSKINFKENNEN